MLSPYRNVTCNDTYTCSFQPLCLYISLACHSIKSSKKKKRVLTLCWVLWSSCPHPPWPTAELPCGNWQGCLHPCGNWQGCLYSSWLVGFCRSSRGIKGFTSGQNEGCCSSTWKEARNSSPASFGIQAALAWQLGIHSSLSYLKIFGRKCLLFLGEFWHCHRV